MSLKSWKDLPQGGLILQAGSSKENKTGSWRSKKPIIDIEKCTKCQRCTLACPEKVMGLGKNRNIEIDYDYCKGCGICAQACPAKAIKLE